MALLASSGGKADCREGIAGYNEADKSLVQTTNQHKHSTD